MCWILTTTAYFTKEVYRRLDKLTLNLYGGLGKLQLTFFVK